LNWNPVYNLIQKIKKDYIKKFGEIKEYNLEKWLNELNNKEYNDFFSCLQLNHHNGELLIRYGIADMQESMWTDSNSLYRECRSLVIDLINDEIIACPFRKFFNLNETQDTMEEIIQEKIKNAKMLEITDKKDGSMQFARYYKGQIKLYGSMALSPKNSWRLADGYAKITPNIEKMIKDNENLTFIFEYISLKDQHVVNYTKNEEGLYLLGVRNVLNGRESYYYEIEKMAKNYNVPMVEIQNKSFEQILSEMKIFKSDEKEGWVCNIIFRDGENLRFKLKCDQYVEMHRMLDKISSVNVIIKSIAEDKFDDLISKIPDNYKEKSINIANQVFNYITNMKKKTNEYYNLAPQTSKKDFMIWVDNNIPKEFRGYLRNKYLNIEFNFLKNNNSYKKAKDIGIILDE